MGRHPGRAGTQFSEHLRSVEQATGDWRQAVDGLRVHLPTLWGCLDETERADFLREDAGRWSVLRHRMAPESMAQLAALRDDGRLTVDPARVEAVEPLPRGGLRVTLTDGTTRDVGWVVNCTGPDSDVRNAHRSSTTCSEPARVDPRRRRHRRHGLPHRPRPARRRAGSARRRSGRSVRCDAAELWESTAVPEIRTQARTVARAILDEVAPVPRTLADGRIVGGHHPIARPRDPLGLAISTTAEAAASFNAGVERVMRLQSGGEDLIREGGGLDPGFAVGHAALAMLGHEAGAGGDVHRVAGGGPGGRRPPRRRARAVVRRRGHASRRRRTRLRCPGPVSTPRLFPRDVLAASAAVPTIAFSGVTDVQQEAWDLVEGLAPAYGDHWWYISLLAFTRQTSRGSTRPGCSPRARCRASRRRATRCTRRPT